MHKSPYYLLSLRRFFPLFVTQFLEAFNDNYLKSAVIILIAYGIARNNAFHAELYSALGQALFIFPLLALSALAGQLADKYDKAVLIRIIKGVELLAMLIAAIGFFTNNIVLLFSAIFLMGVHSTFFGPIKYAILPDVLTKEELIGGNALIEGSTFIAILLGTIVGGVFLVASGGNSPTAIIGLLFALVGLLSAFFIPRVAPNQAGLKLSFNVLKTSWQTVKGVQKNRDVFIAIMAISWFWLVGIALLSLFPTLTKDLLHANKHVAILLLAIFSIGIAVGAIVIERLQKGGVDAKYVPVSIMVMSFFIVDLSFALRHTSIIQGHFLTVFEFLQSWRDVRVMLDLFFIAVAGGTYSVPLYAMMQEKAKKTERSRTVAGLNIISAVFMVAVSLIIMLLSALHLPLPWMILMLGVANIFVAFYLCKLLPHAVVKSFVCWILKLLYRVDVTGLDNYAKASKKAIIVANHVSFLDGLLISAFLPDKLMFVINSYIASVPWIKPLLSLVDAYPLDSTNAMSTKGLIHEIQNNKHCIIFPEGRITVTGSLMKIYEGPGMIADKAGADFLPIRIEGAQYSPFSHLKGKVKIRLFPKITLHILPPRRFHVDANIKGRARRHIISAKLYDLMADLMFDSSNTKQTLFSSLIEARKIHGRRHPIVEDVRRRPLKYQQLLTKSLVLGYALQKQVKQNEHVGVMLPNSVASVVTFYALQAIGCVPTMINFSLGPTNILVTCQTACVKVLLSSSEFIDKADLSDCVGELQKAGITLVLLEDLQKTLPRSTKVMGWLMSHCPSMAYRWLCSAPDPKQAAAVLFTSGSEGAPKGVVLSHINLQSNRLQVASRVDLSAKDTIFNVLPMFHSFGLTAGTLLGTLSGVKVFMYPSPLHYRVIPELIYDTNATVIFGTNTFLSGYARSAHVYDFYSLRYVFAGAEKLHDNTYNTWIEKFGIRIFEGYGVTETSPILSCNTPMQHKTGTVGRFAPKIAHKLEPVQGIAEGGQLLVSGPNVMLGYLLADQPGKLIKTGKWYDTGDIVSIDSEGYVSIQGRVKRFAKISGEMVSLAGVEEIMQQMMPDFQHAMIHLPDVKKGEKLVLITDCNTATREKINAFYQEKGIGAIQLPSEIHILNALPVMGAGKIDYMALHERFLKG